MDVEQHFNDLLAGYAVDILDETEVSLIEQHLAVCEACRIELREYRETANQLVLGAPEAEPDPAIKARLMKAVQSGSSQPGAVLGATWREWLSGFFGRTAPAWGAAALVLVLVFFAANLLLWQRAILPQTAANMRIIELTGTEHAPGASGVLVMSQDGRRGTLVVDRLPILDESQQYQLWLIEAGERVSGGVFSVRFEGYGYLGVKSEAPLSNFDDFGVTIEPEGGSPGPTGVKVLEIK